MILQAVAGAAVQYYEHFDCHLSFLYENKKLFFRFKETGNGLKQRQPVFKILSSHFCCPGEIINLKNQDFTKVDGEFWLTLPFDCLRIYC
jgi:hypothetical protein